MSSITFLGENKCIYCWKDADVVCDLMDQVVFFSSGKNPTLFMLVEHVRLLKVFISLQQP